MTHLHTLLPGERTAAVHGLEALVDARLDALTAAYDRRWAGLRPTVRDWLHEVLVFLLADVRRDVLATLRELLAPPTRVH